MSDHKGPCSSHRLYGLTCDERAALTAIAGDRCGICGRFGPDTGHGYLLIDHDPARGMWAVRGLLCATCNSRIGHGVAVTPQDAAYLADPWWRRRLAALGIDPEISPEPGVGSAVKAGRLTYRRTDEGWECPSMWFSSARFSTWTGLYYTYGPRRLAVISGQLALT